MVPAWWSFSGSPADQWLGAARHPSPRPLTPSLLTLLPLPPGPPSPLPPRTPMNLLLLLQLESSPDQVWLCGEGPRLQRAGPGAWVTPHHQCALVEFS